MGLDAVVVGRMEGTAFHFRWISRTLPKSQVPLRAKGASQGERAPGFCYNPECETLDACLPIKCPGPARLSFSPHLFSKPSAAILFKQQCEWPFIEIGRLVRTRPRQAMDHAEPLRVLVWYARPLFVRGRDHPPCLGLRIVEGSRQGDPSPSPSRELWRPTESGGRRASK